MTEVERGHPAGAERGGVELPPPLLYAAGFLAGGLLELAVSTPDLPFPFAAIAAVVGITMWMALDPWAMVLFGRDGTTVAAREPATALVTTGPYRFTRNPMYLGMAFLHAGLALAFGLFWALALLPVVLGVVDRLVIPPEERHLEATFGEEYRAYRSRVRRWL